uniref:Uncharacterized protein n=1 Tax=Helianthus annuus TaxID=4232 RepID=A0A251US87_HELAN
MIHQFLARLPIIQPRHHHHHEVMEGWDPTTKSALTRIPLLIVKTSPHGGAV